MSDPEVIGDRERYADVGREYRGSSAPTSWPRSGATPPTTPRARASCSPRTTTPETARAAGRSEPRLAELEEEIRLAMVEPDPTTTRT